MTGESEENHEEDGDSWHGNTILNSGKVRKVKKRKNVSMQLTNLATCVEIFFRIFDRYKAMEETVFYVNRLYLQKQSVGHQVLKY